VRAPFPQGPGPVTPRKWCFDQRRGHQRSVVAKGGCRAEKCSRHCGREFPNNKGKSPLCRSSVSTAAARFNSTLTRGVSATESATCTLSDTQEQYRVAPHCNGSKSVGSSRYCTGRVTAAGKGPQCLMNYGGGTSIDDASTIRWTQHCGGGAGEPFVATSPPALTHEFLGLAEDSGDAPANSAAALH